MSSMIEEKTFGFSCIICGVRQKPISQSWCLSLCEFWRIAAAKEAINSFNEPAQAVPAGGYQGFSFYQRTFPLWKILGVAGTYRPRQDRAGWPSLNGHHVPEHQPCRHPVPQTTGTCPPAALEPSPPPGDSTATAATPSQTCCHSPSWGCSPARGHGKALTLPGHRDHGHGDHGHSDHGNRDHGHNDHGQGDHGHGDHTHRDHRLRDYRPEDHEHSDHGHGDHRQGDHSPRNHGPKDHGHGDQGPGDHGAEQLSSASAVQAAILTSWSVWHHRSHEASREQWGKHYISIWEAFLYSAKQKLLQ